MGLVNNQMRLFGSVCSQTSPFRGHGPNFGPGQRSLHYLVQSRKFTSKECRGNGSSSPQRVRVLQPLLQRKMVNLKHAYFHIQIAPHDRPFLRFALKGMALPVYFLFDCLWHHAPLQREWMQSSPPEREGSAHPELSR